MSTVVRGYLAPIVFDTFPFGLSKAMGVPYVPKHQHLADAAVPLIQFIPPAPIRPSCPPTPMDGNGLLETAQLTHEQQTLGDRLGKDVFFYTLRNFVRCPRLVGRLQAAESRSL